MITTILAIIILLLLNCLIGCVCLYLVFKEITLGNIISACIIGFIFPIIALVAFMCNIFDKLDEIKIIKK